MAIEARPNPYVIGAPPRLSGAPVTDARVLLKWVTDLYNVLVREMKLGETIETLKAATIDQSAQLIAMGIASALVADVVVAPGTIGADDVVAGQAPIAGAVPTDLVLAALPTIPSGPLSVTARIESNDVARWLIINHTAAPVAVPTGTLRLVALRMREAA